MAAILSSAVIVKIWLSNYTPQKIVGCDYLSMPQSQLNHTSEFVVRELFHILLETLLPETLEIIQYEVSDVASFSKGIVSYITGKQGWRLLKFRSLISPLQEILI